MKYKTKVDMGAGGALIFLAFALTNFAAWVTHIFWTIGTLTGDATVSQMVFAVLGAVFFPLGILHGWYLWFT